jgi:hypothetical protein
MTPVLVGAPCSTVPALEALGLLEVAALPAPLSLRAAPAALDSAVVDWSRCKLKGLSQLALPLTRDSETVLLEIFAAGLEVFGAAFAVMHLIEGPASSSLSVS